MKNKTLITLIIIALILCPISTTTVFSTQARGSIGVNHVVLLW